METTELFLCDIRGTINFSNIISQKERKIEVDSFVTNLEGLKDIDSADNFIFSSDRLDEYAKYYYNEFTNALNNSNINFGIFYTEDKYLYSSNVPKLNPYHAKIDELVSFIKKCYSKKLNISKVYYAEDGEVNHNINLKLMKKVFDKILLESKLLPPEIISFIPNGKTEHSLVETNELIKEYIKKHTILK